MRSLPGPAIAPVVLLALLTGCAGGGPVASVTGRDDDGLNGAVLVDKYVVPPDPLVDTTGAPYSLVADTDRPLTLVFFGYTHCPDICQLVMANLASALTRLSDEQRAQVDVVLVTTDPARDDGPALRDYLDRFDPSFIGLTGDLDTITGLGRELGVYIAEGEKLPSGGYEVDHGTPVIAIDDTDRTPVVWTQGTSAAALAEDIATLLNKDGS